jgi:hypothetical protein
MPSGPIHYALVFVGCVLLGLGLRSEQVAHAWGADCRVWTLAELIEVRRLEGSGDIATEEMSWQGQLSLHESRWMYLDRPLPLTYESFLLEFEEAP